MLPIRLIAARDGEADSLLRRQHMLPESSCSVANPRRNMATCRAIPSGLAHESVPSTNASEKLSCDVMSAEM
jgi:hypothetical protein